MKLKVSQNTRIKHHQSFSLFLCESDNKCYLDVATLSIGFPIYFNFANWIWIILHLRESELFLTALISHGVQLWPFEAPVGRGIGFDLVFCPCWDHIPFITCLSWQMSLLSYLLSFSVLCHVCWASNLQMQCWSILFQFYLVSRDYQYSTFWNDVFTIPRPKCFTETNWTTQNLF